MTLSELRRAELALMRQAFETACLLAGLRPDARNSAVDDVFADIASTIQRLVESGIADRDVIARSAVDSCEAGSLSAGTY